jgi:hypothetical protein
MLRLGEDSRAAPVAFLEDLVKVTTGTGIERFEAQSSRMSSWTPVRPRRVRA